MSIKYTDEFIKKNTIASVIGVLTFFLPWISFDFVGTISLTGYDMLPKEGFSVLYLFPLGFIVNIILVNLKKENLMYIRSLVFAIPFVLGIIRLKDIYSWVSAYDATGAFREAITELIKLPTYGFYVMLVCIIYIYFIPGRITDVNDPDFGEI